MSQPNQVRLSDSIVGKLIQGGVPANLDGLRFNTALNIWEFAPFGGAGADTWIFAHDLSSTIGTGLTRFSPPAGLVGFVTSAVNSRTIMPKPFTWSRLSYEIAVNSGDDTAVHRSRVNGVIGNQIVTVGIGLVGSFQDLVNTDVIANADEIDLENVNNSTVGAYEVRAYSSVGTT